MGGIIQRFVRQCVRRFVLFAGNISNTETLQRAGQLHYLLILRAQGGVLNLIMPVNLLHHQLRVRLYGDIFYAQLDSFFQPDDYRLVFCLVIGSNAKPAGDFF
jgi:hypothetical protein